MKNVLFLIIFVQIMCYSQFAGGSGTEEDPWLIRTASNLDSIRYYSGDYNVIGYYHFKQIADIDLGVSPWCDGDGWEPIVEKYGRSAFIKYDGNGYKIKNLYINKPDSSFIGLFAMIDNVYLDNMTLSDVNIMGGEYVGSLAGISLSSVVRSSSASGIVRGTSSVGGFIGGISDQAVISNSYNTADITGVDKVGGLIGSDVKNNKYLSLGNSYSIGTVTGTSSDSGGLVGYSTNTAYSSHCYWDIEASLQNTSVYGEGRTTEEMTFDYSDNTYVNWDFQNRWAEDLDSLNNGYPFFQYEINKECPSAPLNLKADNSQPGGLVVNISWNNPDTLINGETLTDLKKVYLYRNFDILKIYNSPNNNEFICFTDTVMVNGIYTYKVVAGNSIGKGICSRYEIPLDGLFAGGSGTESNPYQVYTANHLYNVRNYTDLDNVYFAQSGYINLNTAPWNEGKGWIPIGTPEKPFKGSYKSGYINGLTINDASINNAGLFGAVVNADLQGINMENVNILGNLACGALAGSSYASKISYCSTEGGTVKGNEEVGGLIGSAWHSNIISSSSKTNVEGINNAGGFTGFSCSAIKDCYSRGTVKGDSLVAGFVAVTSDSTISNCYSSGLVIGDVSTGGFSAQGSSALTQGCYWDIERSTQIYSSGGEGKTTMEMFSPSTYSGWDFENIWQISPYENDGYPNFWWQMTGIETPETSVPEAIQLYQNFPNPFNPATDIKFALKEKSDVSLLIFNSKGELVRTLFEGTKDKGMHTVRFDASGLNSGLYFYRLTSGNKSETKKMMMLK